MVVIPADWNQKIFILGNYVNRHPPMAVVHMGVVKDSVIFGNSSLEYFSEPLWRFLEAASGLLFISFPLNNPSNFHSFYTDYFCCASMSSVHTCYILLHPQCWLAEEMLEAVCVCADVLAKRWGGGLFIRSRARVGDREGDGINLRVQAYSCQPVWGGEADGGKEKN